MSDSEDEGSVYSDAGSGRNEGGSDVSTIQLIKGQKGSRAVGSS